MWRTVTGNLGLLDEFLEKYPELTDEDPEVVRERSEELLARIDDTPKTPRWKLRATIGERVKWYKDVEELAN